MAKVGTPGYASHVNPIAAALIGGFLGALVMGAIGIVLDWQRGQRSAYENQKQRAHDLEVRLLDQHHQVQRAIVEDAARLRDARFARLSEDARELARALFDLERLSLLLQWAQPSDKAEMERLETSARVRFQTARAGLTLDPEGARLTATFESLTREIAQYQSMLQSHRVLVEARAVQQVVDHLDQMEEQRNKVVAGITSALGEIQGLLESVAVPVQAPPARQEIPIAVEPPPAPIPSVAPSVAPSGELAASNPT